MKYFKWVSIVIGSLMAVVFLAVLGIQFYLNTEQFRQQTLAKVNQAIPGTITWNQNRFSVLSGKAELNHVLLTGPEKDTLIELEQLSINVSWTGLLKGALYIDHLFLKNPNVFLVKERSGNLNLIQALYTPGDKPPQSTQNGGLPFNILLGELRVINGFFQYNTAQEITETETDQAVFQNVNLTITNGNLLKQSGRLVCQIINGKIQRKGHQTTIDQLSLKADVQKNRIDEFVIDVDADDIYANVTGTIENPFTEKPILDLRLKSRASLSKVIDLMALGSDFSGTVQLNSILKGTLENPDIDFILNYEGGKLAGNSFGQLHLNGRLKEKILNIDNTYVYTPLGKFHMRGDVDFRKSFTEGVLTSNPDLDTISYQFSIHQKESQLSNLPSGISGFKGVANAHIELEGKGVYPSTLWAKTALEIYINKLSSKDGNSSRNVHVSAQAEMKKGRVTIGNLTAGSGESRFEMNGDYDVFSHQVAAHFKLETPDLAEITTSLGINGVLGKMNISGDVSGTLRHPSMTARLYGENLGFENIRFGKADINIRFLKGRLSMEHGKILNGNSGLDFSGFARIFDPGDFKLLENPDFDVELKGDVFFLEDFVQGMRGKFVLNGRVNGSKDHPKGQFNLSGKEVDLYIQKLNKVKLASTIDGRQIHIDPLSLEISPGEKIVLNGWVSMDKEYDLKIVSSDISFKNIKKMALLKIDRGKISFDISGKGGFENPQLKGKVILSDLSFNNQRLEKVPFEIKVEDQTASLSGGLDFTLDATYGLQSRFFATSARFDNTDLTPYLQLVGKKELNGAIAGSMELKGHFGTPIRIEGTTRMSQLEIFWKDTPLIKGNDLMLLVHNDEISIPGMRLSLVDQGHITIKGSGKLNKDLNLEADGNVPFEILPMLTDTFSDATGDVRFSLKVNGSLSAPSMIIHADIKDGGMNISGLFQKLHHMNGHVRINSDAIELDNIQGMLDAGKFELKGAIDLDRYQPSNIGLKLKVDNLPISIPDLLDIRFNSELDVQGSPEKSLIKGNVELIEGTYEKDVRLNLMESMGQASREKPLVTSKTPWPIFDNMALDCKIRYRDPFVVDNNIALLIIKPDLHIHGTVSQPLVSGRAEVESGTVYFQRNEFNVKKGVFDFINPYKIEPTIDIQSDVKIREWTVYLNISGTPDTLRFDMNSDPPEREEDIISLLISGKTTQELIAREGGSSLSPKQMLADVLAETVQKDIKDATGLDVLVLEYNEAKDADTTDEVKVTVGKELSRRVTVKYDLQTKDAKVIRKVITEYKFLEKVLMNAFQDTEGHYGGGIQFRLEFR
ncbi:MAG: translocation/assembly module TamB domain-containing protein [Deltaproteobacteria bacterium]|jgi:autotransporter translocation and assembly factor TamB|nr:translocation/assembly module TamB domain-containing protein [Deltaproteobacteria bacterium]